MGKNNNTDIKMPDSLLATSTENNVKHYTNVYTEQAMAANNIVLVDNPICCIDSK